MLLSVDGLVRAGDDPIPAPHGTVGGKVKSSLHVGRKRNETLQKLGYFVPPKYHPSPLIIVPSFEKNIDEEEKSKKNGKGLRRVGSDSKLQRLFHQQEFIAEARTTIESHASMFSGAGYASTTAAGGGTASRGRRQREWKVAPPEHLPHRNMGGGGGGRILKKIQLQTFHPDHFPSTPYYPNHNSLNRTLDSLAGREDDDGEESDDVKKSSTLESIVSNNNVNNNNHHHADDPTFFLTGNVPISGGLSLLRGMGGGSDTTDATMKSGILPSFGGGANSSVGVMTEEEQVENMGDLMMTTTFSEEEQREFTAAERRRGIENDYFDDEDYGNRHDMTTITVGNKGMVRNRRFSNSTSRGENININNNVAGDSTISNSNNNNVALLPPPAAGMLAARDSGYLFKPVPPVQKKVSNRLVQCQQIELPPLLLCKKLLHSARTAWQERNLDEAEAILEQLMIKCVESGDTGATMAEAMFLRGAIEEARAVGFHHFTQIEEERVAPMTATKAAIAAASVASSPSRAAAAAALVGVQFLSSMDGPASLASSLRATVGGGGGGGTPAGSSPTASYLSSPSGKSAMMMGPRFLGDDDSSISSGGGGGRGFSRHSMFAAAAAATTFSNGGGGGVNSVFESESGVNVTASASIVRIPSESSMVGRSPQRDRNAFLGASKHDVADFHHESEDSQFATSSLKFPSLPPLSSSGVPGTISPRGGFGSSAMAFSDRNNSNNHNSTMSRLSDDFVPLSVVVAGNSSWRNIDETAVTTPRKNAENTTAADEVTTPASTAKASRSSSMQHFKNLQVSPPVLPSPRSYFKNGEMLLADDATNIPSARSTVSRPTSRAITPLSPTSTSAPPAGLDWYTRAMAKRPAGVAGLLAAGRALRLSGQWTRAQRTLLRAKEAHSKKMRQHKASALTEAERISYVIILLELIETMIGSNAANEQQQQQEQSEFSSRAPSTPMIGGGNWWTDPAGLTPRSSTGGFNTPAPPPPPTAVGNGLALPDGTTVEDLFIEALNASGKQIDLSAKKQHKKRFGRRIRKNTRGQDLFHPHHHHHHPKKKSLADEVLEGLTSTVRSLNFGGNDKNASASKDNNKHQKKSNNNNNDKSTDNRGGPQEDISMGGDVLIFSDGETPRDESSSVDGSNTDTGTYTDERMFNSSKPFGSDYGNGVLGRSSSFFQHQQQQSQTNHHDDDENKDDDDDSESDDKFLILPENRELIVLVISKWAEFKVHVTENIPDAISLWNRVISFDDKCAKAWAELGHIKSRMGDVDEALDCYEKTLELEPNRMDALVGFGMLHLKEGSEKIGLQVLNRACLAHPAEPLPQFLIGEHYFSQKNKLDLAKKYLRRSIELGVPVLEKAQVMLSWILLRSGRDFTIVFDLLGSINEDFSQLGETSDMVELFSARAAALLLSSPSSERLGAAFDLLTACRQVCPQCGESLAWLALLKLLMKKSDESTSWTSESLLLSPKDSLARLMYAQQLKDISKDMQSAISISLSVLSPPPQTIPLLSSPNSSSLEANSRDNVHHLANARLNYIFNSSSVHAQQARVSQSLSLPRGKNALGPLKSARERGSNNSVISGSSVSRPRRSFDNDPGYITHRRLESTASTSRFTSNRDIISRQAPPKSLSSNNNINNNNSYIKSSGSDNESSPYSSSGSDSEAMKNRKLLNGKTFREMKLKKKQMRKNKAISCEKIFAAPAFALMAQSLSAYGDVANAEKAAMCALELDPNHLDAMLVIADRRIQSGLLLGAASILRRVLHINPTHSLARDRLSKIMSVVNDRQSSRAATRDSSSNPPQSSSFMRRPLQSRQRITTATYVFGSLSPGRGGLPHFAPQSRSLGDAFQRTRKRLERLLDARIGDGEGAKKTLPIYRENDNALSLPSESAEFLRLDAVVDRFFLNGLEALTAGPAGK